MVKEDCNNAAQDFPAELFIHTSTVLFCKLFPYHIQNNKVINFCGSSYCTVSYSRISTV